MANAKPESPATSQSTGFGLPRLIPSLPMNMLNSMNPFASTEQKPASEVREANNAEGGLAIPFLKRPLFGSILRSSTPPVQDAEANGHTHTRNQSTVMFAEPELEDSDNASREGSVAEDARRRRRNKAKTSYSVCHPPPASSTRQKLHRRPRSLLQLHKLTPTARPVPAFEVIPSANFSVRLVKSITKTYKAKHGLCPNDMVILHAEDYYTQEQADEQEVQGIVALICRGKSNDTKANIIMRDGEEWEALPHTCGGYDFHTVDDHGLNIHVRWVPKKSREGRHGKDKRFNFSTIAAGTRKHPVIASLSGTCLEINDTYKVPDPAVPTPLSTPKQGDGFLGAAMEAEDAPGDECTTDDRLRSIITVTAIFVTFMESSSQYKPEDKDMLTASPRKDDRSGSTPPASPAQMRMLEKRDSIRSISSGLMRRTSMLSTMNRNSIISVDSVTSTDTAAAAPPSQGSKHGRSRSDSASTVLVHRATTNRHRAKQQATWRPDLLSAKNALPEASREDVSRLSSDRKTKRRSGLDKNASKDGAGTTADESEMEQVKRESSTTTETTASDTVRPQPADFKRSSTSRKPSRWRKILSCMK